MISATLLALSLAQSKNLSYRERFPLPDATVPNGWGVNIHFTDPQPGEMEKMAALGIKWVRMDLFWSHVEKEKGRYDFSGYDRQMKHLKKHKIRPLFILDYGNKLYEEGAPKSEAAHAAFVKFAQKAVERYKGQGVLWEMWNEPNLPMFWQPEPNVGLYSKLAVSVGRMIRKVAPEEWYIGPAVSGFDWEFLEGAYSRGVLKYFDAVSVHPYRQTQPETSLADWRRLRALTEKHSEGNFIPLLSGEWGYSDVWKGQTPQQKADYVARQYLNNLAAGVNLSIYYDWKNDGTDPAEPEHHFGILDHALTDKPASKLLAFIAKELHGFTFIADASRDIKPTHGDEARILVFKKGSQVRLAVWSQTNQPFAARLPLTPGKASLISESGTEEVTFTKEKGITFTSTPKVLVPEKVDDWLLDLASIPPRRQEFVVGNEEEALQKLSEWVDSFAHLKAAKLDSLIPAGLTDEDVFEDPRFIITEDKSPENLKKLAAFHLRASCGIGSPVIFHTVFSGPSPVPLGCQLVLWPAIPLDLELSADPLTLILNNPTGWKGTLDWNARSNQPSIFVDGSPRQIVGPLRELRPRLVLTQNKKVVARRPFEKLAPLYDSLPSFISYSEGNQPASSYVRPDSSEPGAFIYSSTFPRGWSYSLIRSEPFPTLATKEGEIVSYGLEVEGDGSGNLLRSRFVDAEGQVFQPNGVIIDWVGWRLVRFEVSTKDAGWWGGPADGVIHWPVKLDNLLLVDSAKRLPGSTKIRFRNPHKILRDPLVQRGHRLNIGIKIDP